MKQVSRLVVWGNGGRNYSDTIEEKPCRDILSRVRQFPWTQANEAFGWADTTIWPAIRTAIARKV